MLFKKVKVYAYPDTFGGLCVCINVYTVMFVYICTYELVQFGKR